MSKLEAFRSWYQKHKEEIIENYLTFLKFRSISTDSSCDAETRATAEWLKESLEKSGLEAALWETERHPAVFAEYKKGGEGAPTYLFYNHYDVQPVDPVELWETNPFDPVIKEGDVFARGAADNKGLCFYTLCAIRAFIELFPSAPINIKVFIEGEEEIGGSGTEKILPAKAEALKSDYLFIVDGGVLKEDQPSIMVGLRGLVALEIEVATASIDLHSGLHGGIALNPNHVLIQVLSKLWDEKGNIAVPFFYDDVIQLSADEKKQLNLQLNKEELQTRFGIKQFVHGSELSPGEASFLCPTLDVNGIRGGYGGEGFKTVIPSKAWAKISCRLVPNQDPEKIGKTIQKFIQHHLPPSLDCKVDILQVAPPFRASAETAIVKIAKEAYEKVFGKPCSLCLCGASVPVVPVLARTTEAEVVVIGMMLDTDDIHAPNEHFSLSRFEKGFLTIAEILSSCSSCT